MDPLLSHPQPPLILVVEPTLARANSRRNVKPWLIGPEPSAFNQIHAESDEGKYFPSGFCSVTTTAARGEVIPGPPTTCQCGSAAPPGRIARVWSTPVGNTADDAGMLTGISWMSWVT